MPCDRRRIGQEAALLLAIVLTAADLLWAPLIWAPPASAQGFGWGFYRAPVQRRRAPRGRAASPRPEPQRLEPQTPAPQGGAPREASVPLPVPRPHFPGDSPEPADATASPKAPDVTPAPVTPVAPREARPGPVRPNERTKPTYGPFMPPAAVALPPKSPESTMPATPPLPPPKPADLAKPGGGPAGVPSVAPSGARLGEVPGQPEDDASCVSRLKARNVDVEPTEIGPQPDERCTVVRAVRLSGLTLRDGGKVAFPERPTIACTTADAFSQFVRDMLSPLAKGTYGASVASVWTGPGLECRSRDHIRGAKLSAHGQGLAIDIAQLKLASGRMIEVGMPKDDADQGFETAARAAGCGYFHTALGPGTDAFHATHWHFDLEVRGAHGDSKYCK